MHSSSDAAAWRRHLHGQAELGFVEKNTSEFVASKLRGFGIETYDGLAGTGVVGVLRSGTSGGGVGLRAELDALPISEANLFDHRSKSDGTMHACGHDGHMAMLLEAARQLAEERNFDGTVYFIFQPAEENLGGARAMIADGLFDRFPMSRVFALHNWPDLEAGHFGIRAGPVMASMDRFEIELKGKGAHAAMPHRGCDPIVAAAQLVTALQTISSRIIDPNRAVVVSVTQIHAGEAWNVIPEVSLMRGTLRTLDEVTRDRASSAIAEISRGVASTHGVELTVTWHRDYPVTLNTSPEAKFAQRVAIAQVGAERVHEDLPPSMAAEDFAFMLNEKPGCYCLIGNGRSDVPLHSPHYDFNDNIIPIGSAFLATLARESLR